jgi:hypothetical protein
MKKHRVLNVDILSPAHFSPLSVSTAAARFNSFVLKLYTSVRLLDQSQFFCLIGDLVCVLGRLDLRPDVTYYA